MAQRPEKNVTVAKEEEKKGISAGTAAVISALIMAVIGPLIVIGTQAYLQYRSKEPIVQTDNGHVDAVTDLEQLRKLGIVVSTEGPGCTDLGKMQLCWGNGVFNPRNDPNTPTCDFELKFANHFASPPSVTTSIQGRTSGFAYAIYSQQVDKEHITGAGLEVLRRASPEPVVVSYIAIGLPAVR